MVAVKVPVETASTRMLVTCWSTVTSSSSYEFTTCRGIVTSVVTDTLSSESDEHSASLKVALSPTTMSIVSSKMA